MKISANSLRKGNVIIDGDELWVVTNQPVHTKPGKGPAYVQIEVRNIKTNIKENKRLSSTDSFTKAHIESIKHQYLYEDGDVLIFMNPETCEQINVDKGMLDETELAILRDQINNQVMIDVQMFGEEVIGVELPKSVVVEIAETDPVIKGAMVAPSNKHAKLTNGLTIKVPYYIISGEKVVIKTEDLSFVERVK